MQYSFQLLKLMTFSRQKISKLFLKKNYYITNLLIFVYDSMVPQCVQSSYVIEVSDSNLEESSKKTKQQIGRKVEKEEIR